jgi:DNA processing protein
MSDTTPDMDTTTLRFWLALHRAPLIGSLRFRRLIAHFGSPRDVFEASRFDWSALGVPAKTMDYLSAPDWSAVDADLRWALDGGPGHHCLTLDHAAYPELLREIADPPAVLFVNGNPAALSVRHIAMVGSRSPTPTGERIAREFARELVSRGAGVISGLALGIDAASHRGALEGQGITVAVAGTGPEHIYPRHHASLAEEILARDGALITEYPTGTGPLAANFPRRNRIISGLALGTLVVEAAPRSGSLITARMALEQNRDVFAVPGSIHSSQSRGCNQLIQQGAKLIQDPSDIIEEYSIFSVPYAAASIPKSDMDGASEEDGLLKYIAYEPTTVDTLVAATGLSADIIVATLLDLELRGRVESMPGGAYIRVG